MYLSRAFLFAELGLSVELQSFRIQIHPELLESGCNWVLSTVAYIAYWVLLFGVFLGCGPLFLLSSLALP